MPMYESRCDVCGEHVEEFRRMADSDRLPSHCGVVMARVYSVPMVSADIQPYQAVAVDKKTGRAPFIESRKAHKEFLKRNQYHEVETSTVKTKPRKTQGDFNLKEDLINAVKQVTGH